MTDTADKALDLASKEMDKITSALSQLAHTYGPDVVNAAVEVARVDALQGIIHWCILFVFMFATFMGGFCIIRNKVALWDRYDSPTPAAVVMFFSFLFSGGFFIAILLTLDVWNFVGIFQPKLYIAHQIISSIK